MLGYQVRDSEYGSVTEGATVLLGDWGYQGKIDFMVLGNGRPNSKQSKVSCSSENEHIWIYLLVGSTDLTLELVFCAAQDQTQRV